MRHRVVPIRNGIPEFPPQLGIQHGDGAIGGDAVSLGVGGVVFQGAQRERVFVEVLRFAQQLRDEIAAANVVREIAEKVAAQRIISHVLDDAAAVGVGVRLFQILRRRARKSFQQMILEGRIPNGVDDRFVGENRIPV